MSDLAIYRRHERQSPIAGVRMWIFSDSFVLCVTTDWEIAVDHDASYIRSLCADMPDMWELVSYP
jgi:hypothetical protein